MGDQTQNCGFNMVRVRVFFVLNGGEKREKKKSLCMLLKKKKKTEKSNRVCDFVLDTVVLVPMR